MMTVNDCVNNIGIFSYANSHADMLDFPVHEFYFSDGDDNMPIVCELDKFRFNTINFKWVDSGKYIGRLSMTDFLTFPVRYTCYNIKSNTWWVYIDWNYFKDYFELE